MQGPCSIYSPNGLQPGMSFPHRHPGFSRMTVWGIWASRTGYGQAARFPRNLFSEARVHTWSAWSRLYLYMDARCVQEQGSLPW